ncbi:phage tail protein, partial [Salmonella enterica subsp. enterica serovar Infantis]
PTRTTPAAPPSAVISALDNASASPGGSLSHAWGQFTCAPDGTLTQKGLGKQNIATGITSTTEAATPSEEKAAYDKASA